MNGRQDQQEQQELQEKVKEIVLQVGHKGQDQDQGESATHGGPTIRNYTHKPTWAITNMTNTFSISLKVIETWQNRLEQYQERNIRFLIRMYQHIASEDAIIFCEKDEQMC